MAENKRLTYSYYTRKKMQHFYEIIINLNQIYKNSEIKSK